MHPLLMFFATLGGLGLWGLTGVVLGPLIAAFLVALLHMYEARYRAELQSHS